MDDTHVTKAIAQAMPVVTAYLDTRPAITIIKLADRLKCIFRVLPERQGNDFER